MRNNIIIGVSALLIGLVAGFFLFGGKGHVSGSDHDHGSNIIAAAQGQESIYTCSMHPQIRQNEPGLCPICAMDLITLDAASGGSDDPLVLSMTEEAVQLANIQTTIVGNTAVVSGKTLRLSGKVQADERLAASLSAHIPGRIEKLYISFTGEQVHKGQKLADIYSPELITAQRELIEAKKLADVSPTLLEAARKKLQYWKIGEEAIQGMEDTGNIQELFTLYAEESGIVNNRRISLGDYVKQGQAMFDLMNLNKVWILFDAYEEDLADISLGNQIEFTTPAIPNQTFQARINFIDPVIDAKTRITSLRTEIGNRQGLLKPEMLVTGTLTSPKTASNQVQLSVPKSAILWTGKRSVVYVKVPDETIPSFKYREVELGESTGENYQVLKGLEAGEEVVTYGSFAIDAAAQLNNQVSMMNKNVVVKDEGASDILPDYKDSSPIAFKQQLGELATVYFGLKDALVATDPEQAIQEAQKVLAQLEQIDMQLLEGEAHLFWMDQRNNIEIHAQKLADFEDVEAQRKQFEFVSEALIQSVKVFGTADQTLYIQHCPMAMNDQGADWLSSEENILNPYFGDKMLTCGFVKGEVGE